MDGTCERPERCRWSVAARIADVSYRLFPERIPAFKRKFHAALEFAVQHLTLWCWPLWADGMPFPWRAGRNLNRFASVLMRGAGREVRNASQRRRKSERVAVESGAHGTGPPPAMDGPEIPCMARSYLRVDWLGEVFQSGAFPAWVLDLIGIGPRVLLVGTITTGSKRRRRDRIHLWLKWSMGPPPYCSGWAPNRLSFSSGSENGEMCVLLQRLRRGRHRDCNLHRECSRLQPVTGLAMARLAGFRFLPCLRWSIRAVPVDWVLLGCRWCG